MPPLEAVRKTLEQCGSPALDVFVETDLTPAWQQAFVSGRVKDPGYSKVVSLTAWLIRAHNKALSYNIAQAKC